MRLWIAEKPDAGRNIAKALGGGSESGGHIKVSNGDVVTWAIGHLLENYMPHEYDERFKKWELGHLPILPPKFLYHPITDKMNQLNVIKRLVGQASEVVIATDAGREGEAIAWLVLDYCGWKGPAKRLWTSSLTPSSMAKAIGSLIDDKEKKAMYIAARLRSSMDWSDGINWSRYYNIRCTNHGDKTLSIGRVQTATLALVIDRDIAIEAFKPSDYFELKATMDLPQGKLELFHAPQGDNKILDKAEADEIARKCRGVPTVLKVDKKPKNFSPPPPYSLPELQMHASSLWGWSSDKTLEVLQKLYEAGAVTYPRTDSGHLAEDMVGDMPRHLAALKKRAQYRELATMEPTYRKSIFDDKKVGDHHGIITTEEAVDVTRLGPDAEFLFDLVARRFLACLMPDAQGTTTSIRAVISGVTFSTAGTIITVPGWKAAWAGLGDPDEKKTDEVPEGDEEDGKAKAPTSNRILPPVSDGQSAVADRIDVQTKTTKPPPYFTEGTLIKAMMSAGAKEKDLEIRDLLSNGGLGTGATRQEAIKKLKMREFIINKGKKILSTPRAREFMVVIRQDGNKLADVVATANLERELRAVEKDPRQAPDIWRRYAADLQSDMSRLVSGPAPRKLSPAPRTASGSQKAGSSYKAAGSRPSTGSAPKKKAASASGKSSYGKSPARGSSPRTR
jgi:DNA topoisomerase-3